MTFLKTRNTHTDIHTGYAAQPVLAFSVALKDCIWIDWITLWVGFCPFLSRQVTFVHALLAF